MRFLLLLLTVCLLLSWDISAQRKSNPQEKKADTLHLKKGTRITYADSTITLRSDTIIINNDGQIRVKADPYNKSAVFYDSLQERASKRKLTRELHDLVIKKGNQEKKIDSVIFKSEDYFKPFSGMTIRNIFIRKVDLLEGSVIDTTLEATTKVGKWVNRLHADTRDFIIRNNLIFASGDPVDPYRLADNERILRQFSTIRDARIYLKPNLDEPGTVDVIVVTQDVASAAASGTYGSLGDFRLDLFDINMLGYAKQLQLSYYRNTNGTPSNGYEVLLREPNFGGSFIQGEIKYTDNYLRNRLSLFAGRDFLTPKMKYAGGIEAFRTKENYVINRNDTMRTPYAQERLDIWLGRSIPVAARTNLIFSIRSASQQFTERPFISADSNYFFFRRSLWLGSIALFKTNYFKGSLISGFGRTEDVPVNAWAGVTLGREQNEFTDRNYFGLKSGIGQYFERVGYTSLSFSADLFRAGNEVQDGTISVNALYFTNLFRMSRTKIRQFVTYSYIQGFNRTVIPDISLQRGWRDRAGFIPLGTQRMTLGFETVYFTPWYLYGFRFALYDGADLNFLSGSPQLLDGQHFFPSLKGGIRVLNDNLVFPILSIDLDYYIKSGNYKPSFSIGISTTLPRIFGAPQSFRPAATSFQ